MNPGSPDYRLDPDVRRLGMQHVARLGVCSRHRQTDRPAGWCARALSHRVPLSLAVPDQTTSCRDCNTFLYVKKMRVFAADKGRGKAINFYFLVSCQLPTSLCEHLFHS
jgi:hypothetical protein